MEEYTGTAASPGIAIAQALILDSQEFPISHRKLHPSEVPAEKERFGQAVQDAIRELLELQRKASDRMPGEYLKVFDAHVSMLQDRSLRATVLETIESRCCAAELAVSVVIKQQVREFRGNEALERLVHDLYDIEHAVLRSLHGMKREDLSHLEQNVIIVAKDLTPTQTVTLDKGKVLAFATDAGGRTSHTAIVARALGIPAVVGLGEITAAVVAGDLLIVDGNTGTVVVNPEPETLDGYHAQMANIQEHEVRLARLRQLPAETTDGHRITLKANIESSDEAKIAVERGAEGVGLYRTEFLFFEKGRAPTEEEHYEAYLRVVRAFGDRPVTIRTVDMGGDKFLPDGAEREANPFLGCRSIRYCFEHEDMFRTQIRAILRASAHGRVNILFPMIAFLWEIRRAKKIVEEVKAGLDEAGVAFDRGIRMGIMIEVPSAAWIIDQLAAEVHFFSIGTNDLIQYSLAVDRGNAAVKHLFQPAHPAVLRMVKHVVEAGRKHRVRVAMCGEMSGEVNYAVLLVGLGLAEFSVSPLALPSIKEVVRRISADDAAEVARTALAFDEAERTVEYLKNVTRDLLREAT